MVTGSVIRLAGLRNPACRPRPRRPERVGESARGRIALAASACRGGNPLEAPAILEEDDYAQSVPHPEPAGPVLRCGACRRARLAGWMADEPGRRHVQAGG